jgi:hypothetical protein
MIFVILKILHRKSADVMKPSLYDKMKIVLYNLHKAGSILGTIFAFIHGLAYESVPQGFLLTGWILGGFMIILSGMGIFMGFQNKWIPFDDEKNKKFKTLRIIKWFLTTLMLAALIFHIFPQFLGK